MRFKCPKCGRVFTRDLRKTENKYAYNKKNRTYKSGCENSSKSYWCRETKEKETS